MVEHFIIDCVCDIDYSAHKTSHENITVNKYNLINSCGSVLPAMNKGKEVGLLHHNLQKCNAHLLSRKKTSDSNNKIYEFC
jgi:hypothetical protein